MKHITSSDTLIALDDRLVSPVDLVRALEEEVASTTGQAHREAVDMLRDARAMLVEVEQMVERHNAGFPTKLHLAADNEGRPVAKIR